MALVPFPSVTPGDDEDDDPNIDDSGSKMSFLEHLDELRKRLIYIVYSLIAGCCIVGVVSMYSSLVQLTTSDDMRGRVMSIFMLAFRGGMPLGNLLAGWIAEKWSISVALMVTRSTSRSIRPRSESTIWFWDEVRSRSTSSTFASTGFS